MMEKIKSLKVLYSIDTRRDDAELAIVVISDSGEEMHFSGICSRTPKDVAAAFQIAFDRAEKQY